MNNPSFIKIPKGTKIYHVPFLYIRMTYIQINMMFIDRNQAQRLLELPGQSVNMKPEIVIYTAKKDIMYINKVVPVGVLKDHRVIQKRAVFLISEINGFTGLGFSDINVLERIPMRTNSTNSYINRSDISDQGVAYDTSSESTGTGLHILINKHLILVSYQTLISRNNPPTDNIDRSNPNELYAINADGARISRVFDIGNIHEPPVFLRRISTFNGYWFGYNDISDNAYGFRDGMSLLVKVNDHMYIQLDNQVKIFQTDDIIYDYVTQEADSMPMPFAFSATHIYDLGQMRYMNHNMGTNLNKDNYITVIEEAAWNFEHDVPYTLHRSTTVT